MGFVSYREDNEEKQDDGSNSMTDSSNLINELAEILGSMYHNAPNSEKSTAVQLCGIRYETNLAEPDVNINRVVQLSRLRQGYGAEIRKGMKLVKYVDLNAIGHVRCRPDIP